MGFGCLGAVQLLLELERFIISFSFLTAEHSIGGINEAWFHYNITVFKHTGIVSPHFEKLKTGNEPSKTPFSPH